MTSTDRKLFGTTIRQDTNGFLNLSDLQHTYNDQAEISGWSKKRIDMIFSQQENYERIYYILKEQGLINDSILAFIEMIKNEKGIIRTLKKLKIYKTTGARHTKTIWCDPYLWMLAALELHPEIYAKTVIWLADNLILNRIEAGNMYRGLSMAIATLSNVDYRKMARSLNYVVFGRHERALRDKASISQLKELEDLEKHFAFAIDMGYIKTFDRFIEEMRRMWRMKWSIKPYVIKQI